MEQLKPSTTLPDSKIFHVNKSQIDERYDPFYIYHKLNSALESKYDSVKLKKLVQSFSGGTPAKDFQEYWTGTVPWVSPKDFNSFEIFDTKDTISEQGVKNSSTKIAPVNSILMVVRSGVLAHTLPVSINRIPVAINQDLKAFIPKKNNLLPEYLGYYFLAFGEQLLPLITKHSTTVHSINTEQFERLEIPVPPIAVQRKVINTFTSVLKKKKQKEAQAKDLLNSIDDYLLDELGIELPEKDNSLESRIFTISFQKVLGRRLDPKPYDKNSRALFNAVDNSEYPKVSLRELLTHSASGKWGKETNAKVKKEDYEKCLVIRATEFSNLYNLKLENERAKYRLVKKTKLKKLDLQINDLLIEKSGGSPDQPVGRIALLRKELFKDYTLCFSNFIHKIRVYENRILPEYLFCFLKTMHNIKITEIMQSQTSGIRNLIMSEYLGQQIVVPKLSKQKEIAKKASRRRFQAQKLETEAKAEVEKARQQVEKMILSDEVAAT